MTQPRSPLPLPTSFDDAESYVNSLLEFGTTSQILHTLCGGVHILDFFTRTPDLYPVVLPNDWRSWFEHVEVQDVLDLLMREDLSQFGSKDHIESAWRGVPKPPQSLIDYVFQVRNHLLSRSFTPLPAKPDQKPSRQVFMGMNPKKIHEVDNFARYMDELASEIETSTGEQITHLADFGAGQNYLGRVLASSPYNRRIIAIESRPHVVEGARSLDIHTKIVEKPKIIRNKKVFRATRIEGASQLQGSKRERLEREIPSKDVPEVPSSDVLLASMDLQGKPNSSIEADDELAAITNTANTVKDITETKVTIETPETGKGTIQYVEHRISDGNLASVVDSIVPLASTVPAEVQTSNTSAATPDSLCSILEAPSTIVTKPASATDHHRDPSLMVISLHSCGNLVHHGLRTLALNPAVKAVALIGCCYNLMTERLGPPTHKMSHRQDHPRLTKTGEAYDPHGFPMSNRFAKYKHRGVSQVRKTPVNGESHDVSDCNRPSAEADTNVEEGIRLNITARMMAVQAPQNWTAAESSSFFKRHFYRAVLQKILVDKGVVGAPPSNQEDDMGCSPAGSSWSYANGDGDGTAPVVIGSLKKKCYGSFPAYVRGAVEKLVSNGGGIADAIVSQVGTMSDDDIRQYEARYQARKKDLSIIWSLMAFSAGVVESMIVVDRWLWLKEQRYIRQAWVEPVFDYALSPRNLVIVGVKGETEVFS